MKERDRSRERARLYGSRDDWSNYRKLRNNVTKETRKCKNDYYSNLYTRMASEKDTKSIYVTTRELLGWQRDSGPRCFFWEGQLVRKPVQLARIQMDFFRDKIRKLSDNILRQKSEYIEQALEQRAHRVVATAVSTTTTGGGSHRPPNITRVVATAAPTTTSSGGSHRPPNITSVVATAAPTTTSSGGSHCPPNNAEIMSMNPGNSREHDIDQELEGRGAAAPEIMSMNPGNSSRT